VVAGAALAVSLAAFPFGAMSQHYFTRAAASYEGDGSTIVATREGPSETLFVMQQQWLGKPVYSRLVTNGFSMSGTALLGQRYMRAFAYYPMLLHDGPLRRALVVCYGVGVTVGALTHIPSVGTIDVAEISKDVVAMSDAIYPPDARPLNDPRVRLHIEDGRFFLQTTTERFDLITGEPPPPRTPGTVNIYTREYFELVRDRLADGGIATYWVPVARPHPGTDANTIIRAFCDAFPDCSLWNATPFDLMLVGSRGLTGPRTAAQFTAPWQTPGLESRLREVGFERAEQIGATFIGDAGYLRELTMGTPPLTDDFPQRLRPVRGRPSLSDPGYGVDEAVTRMYQATLDPVRARNAFATSRLIRALWPPDLLERTLPYFEQQAVINRVYWDGGRPLRQIEDLDALLGKTTLRTLPLWVLGSDEVKQRIAETSGDATGAVEFARGLRALSGRDYGGAAHWLDAAAARGLTLPTLRPLLAYALVKSGQGELARSLAPRTPTDADERHFWDWLRAGR
jgi:spermidine synthase